MQNEIEELAGAVEKNTALDALPDLRSLILATPVCRRLYFAAAIRCLGARRFFFDKEAGAMQFEPDGTAVMRAVAWLSSYDAGLPVQTTVNLNIGKDKGDLSFEQALAESPELRQALTRFVTAAERKAPRNRKGAEKPAELADGAPSAEV